MRPLVNGALSRERTFGGISLVDPTTLEPSRRMSEVRQSLCSLWPSVTMPESHEYDHRCALVSKFRSGASVHSNMLRIF